MQRYLYVILIILFASIADARTTHYVTESGAGSKDGSSAGNAWSISDFNDSFPFTTICGEGANQVKPGDTVYFTGNLDSTVSPHCSGTSGSRLTFDFTGSTFIDTTDAIKVSLNGSDYITITNWTTKTGFSTANLVFRLSTGGTDTNSSYVTIQNGSMNGAVNKVIDTNYSDHTTIYNNSFLNTTYGAIVGNRETIYLTISGNTITSAASPTYSYDIDLIHLACAQNVTLANNILKFQHTTAPAGGDPHNDIFQIYACYDPTQRPSGITAYGNYFEINSYGNNLDSFTMQTGLDGVHVWYNNIFYSKDIQESGAQSGLGFECATADCRVYVYENTFHLSATDYGNMCGAVTTGDIAAEFHVKNNIFYLETGATYTLGDGFKDCSSAVSDIDYNYISTDAATTFKQVTCGTSTQKNFSKCSDAVSNGYIGSHNICGGGDPFTTAGSDWTLATGKTPIDAGAALGSPYDVDKNAVSRPQGAGYDLGAYEYTEEEPPPASAGTTIGSGVTIGNGVTIR